MDGAREMLLVYEKVAAKNIFSESYMLSPVHPSVCWPDCKPEGTLFSAEFVCVCVCVSLTGTSTLQR